MVTGYRVVGVVQGGRGEGRISVLDELSSYRVYSSIHFREKRVARKSILVQLLVEGRARLPEVKVKEYVDVDRVEEALEKAINESEVVKVYPQLSYKHRWEKVDYTGYYRMVLEKLFSPLNEVVNAKFKTNTIGYNKFFTEALDRYGKKITARIIRDKKLGLLTVGFVDKNLNLGKNQAPCIQSFSSF